MQQDIRLRVILLEDNDSFRSELSEIFALFGYEVFTFSNPAICPLQMKPACLNNANQTCADIIVLDLDIPIMTGLTFIENQKKKKCKCKHVAIISDTWTDQDLIRAHQLGCGTIEKPLSFEDLFDWLDEVKGSIEPTRELCNWFQEPDHLS